MTEQEMSLIVTNVVNDTKFWVTLVGIIGAVVGSFITLVGNFAIECFKGRKQKNIDNARQKLLKKMLEDKAFQWRNLSTLASVVGCDEEQTKNHLIAIGARGSEKNDGKWGLISLHPLSEINRNDA